MKRIGIFVGVALFLGMFSLTGAAAGDGPAKGKDGAPAVAAAADEFFIRQAYELAIRSGKNGNQTFGALLVHRGKVIMTAENTVVTDGDTSHHAEMNLLGKAAQEFPPEVISESILYASSEPCMACCAAMWVGTDISKVVYGVSHKALERLTGWKDATKGIPCDKLYGQTGKALEWAGPVLEEEGLQVFRYWPETDPRGRKFRWN